MKIIPVPAFRDNYLWVAHDGRHALVVDPGDAAPVLDFLATERLRLVAVLVTHHHPDHVGGLAELARTCPAPVYGPAEEAIAGVTRPLREADRVDVPELGLQFEVLEVPGHTRGHVAYYAPGILFCGDTLFSAGCGRLFEGTPRQMFDSLARLAALPDETHVYCTHEYTLANLAFARMAEPENQERDAWTRECEALRARGLPTLPSTIGRERVVNPFLRTDRAAVRDAVTAWSGTRPEDAAACFAQLRAWKNQA